MNGSVQLFNDVHRWVAIQSEELELIRAKHKRSVARREDAMHDFFQALTADTAERKKDINDFSLEVEQYTLKHFHVLKEELAESMQLHMIAEASNKNNEYARKQRQLNSLAQNLDTKHGSLAKMAGQMVKFGADCQ
eukprot:TRINITY_DN46019_c0_g1_i1.p1 TRINITY_DN46019_c0_g1~~TRINITY_DN46019_c0_g1_i1.p1  ORF type:complete len:136 (+),score=42.87 TRINITY_DN46019_c0_g1_i1:175-582(+)